jgi:hypothetical protein
VLTEQRTRELLLQTWGEQACQRPTDWPSVLENLLRGHPHDAKDFDERGNLKDRARYPRGSLLPALDEAARTLTEAFANEPPADPIDTVWRAFSKLMRELRQAGRAAERDRGP